MLLVAGGLCKCKTGKIKKASIWLLGQQASPLVVIKRRIMWMLEESSESWEQSFIQKWLCYWECEVELWGGFRIVIRDHVFRARYSLTGLPQWLSSNELVCSTADAGDVSSIPRLGISLGGGSSNPLQYSCLENPMDRRAWRATVHRATQSWTQLKRLRIHVHSLTILKAEKQNGKNGPGDLIKNEFIWLQVTNNPTQIGLNSGCVVSWRTENTNARVSSINLVQESNDVIRICCFSALFPVGWLHSETDHSDSSRKSSLFLILSTNALTPTLIGPDWLESCIYSWIYHRGQSECSALKAWALWLHRQMGGRGNSPEERWGAIIWDTRQANVFLWDFFQCKYAWTKYPEMRVSKKNVGKWVKTD